MAKIDAPLRATYQDLRKCRASCLFRRAKLSEEMRDVQLQIQKIDDMTAVLDKMLKLSTTKPRRLKAGVTTYSGKGRPRLTDVGQKKYIPKAPRTKIGTNVVTLHPHRKTA